MRAFSRATVLAECGLMSTLGMIPERAFRREWLGVGDVEGGEGELTGGSARPISAA